MKLIAFVQLLIVSVQSMSTYRWPMSTNRQMSTKILERNTRRNTKTIMEQNNFCFVLASKINSIQNLLVIKQRYPILFDHCKLKIKSTKTLICKRFNWKGRSVHC